MHAPAHRLPDISTQHPDALLGTSTVCDFYFCSQRSNEVHAVPAVYISADVPHNIQNYSSLKVARDALLSPKADLVGESSFILTYFF